MPLPYSLSDALPHHDTLLVLSGGSCKQSIIHRPANRPDDSGVSLFVEVEQLVLLILALENSKGTVPGAAQQVVVALGEL